jgi:hypothetical protein
VLLGFCAQEKSREKDHPDDEDNASNDTHRRRGLTEAAGMFPARSSGGGFA